MATKKPAKMVAAASVAAPVEPEPPVVEPTSTEALTPVKSNSLSHIDKEKALSLIEYALDTLTFKRVGLIALLTTFGLGIFMLYENRKEVVNYFISAGAHGQSPLENQGGIPWTLSEQSKEELRKLVKDSGIVAFVGISDVDLRKNRRMLTFFHQKDPTLKLPVEATRTMSLPQAMFDYDAKNTAQMVSVLSNEFRCDPYRDTINYRYAPEFETLSPIVCRLAIPPFAGQFVGFVTVGISQNLPKQGLDAIRLELSRIAVAIYLNDVIKQPALDTSAKK